MKFFCEGIEWDTDKEVFVAGYNVLGADWFFFFRRERYPGENSAILKDYGVRCKKGRIESISMDFNDGQSFVSDFEVYVPGTGTCRASRTCIGKSVAEVKRIVGA